MNVISGLDRARGSQRGRARWCGRHLRRVGVAVLTLTASALVSSGLPAAASHVAVDANPITVPSTPMTVTKYDRGVANRHGFHIVIGPDGTERSIPVTAAARAAVVRADASLATRSGDIRAGEVVGNCGTAYLYGYDYGSRSTGIVTGFRTNLPTVSFRWSVAVTDPGGSFTKTWGPRENFPVDNLWGDSHSWTAGRTGSALAGIRTGFTTSYAVTIDGGWCTAGPATAAWRIT